MGFLFHSVKGQDVQNTQKKITWKVDRPVFSASHKGGFDDASVKDPSIVFYNEKWHLFYSGLSQDRDLQIGYVNADKLDVLMDGKRHMLEFTNVENLANKYAAPQVFFFEPHQKWYLVFQGYWNDVQPLYSCNTNIEDPTQWTQPKPLMPKFEQNSWVDFYVICDEEYAYLTYSRDYRSVYAVRTSIEDFPVGFDTDSLIKLIDDPNIEFGEAAHIYQALGTDEYHMIYESSDLTNNRERRYSLYSSKNIAGPWNVKYPDYASKELLKRSRNNEGWPEEVSHGEMIRTNYSQNMEYNPKDVRFLMQGIISSERGENYTPEQYWMLPWKFGILETRIYR
jgi:hypothetical protein